MSIAEEIEKLQTLRDRGALSGEEFEKAKALILKGSSVPTSGSALRQLSRSQTDCWLGGVCGGLGENTIIPSWLWRVLFCLTTLIYGVGLFAYILLWIFMPPRFPQPSSPT